MTDVLQNFEQDALQFDPMVTVLGASLLLVAGFAIWLGPQVLKKYLYPTAGVAAGAVCGFLFGAGSLPTTAAVAVITGAFAVVREQLFVALLALAGAVLIAFTVLAWPRIADHTPADRIDNDAAVKVAYTPDQSIDLAGTHAAALVTRAKLICLGIPGRAWVVITMVAVTAFGLAYAAWNLASAFACATLGATLLFAGLALLALGQGTTPMTTLLREPLPYGLAFAGAAGLGTAVQALLLRRKAAAVNKSSPPPGAAPGPARQKWRTT